MNPTILALEELTQHPEKVAPNLLSSTLSFMLEDIGNPDPYVRDTLIFSGFCQLILNDYISSEQCIEILTTCSDDQHLYFEIEQDGKSDAVFVRSFSALALQLVVSKDRENPFVPKPLMIQALRKSINYLQLETDYRGYIEGKGWAHSVAHGSDLLTAAILHPLFHEVSSVPECLLTMKKCLQTEYAYIDEEDERLLQVVDALYEKGLTDAELTKWLKQLQIDEISDSLSTYRKQWNIKKFMYTLYAHLLRKNKCETTQQWIMQHVLLK